MTMGNSRLPSAEFRFELTNKKSVAFGGHLSTPHLPHSFFNAYLHSLS